MATSTTNLGLTKPAGTDKIRIAQINGNMDILDDKIGAVGNTSLQAQITSQNQALSKLDSNTNATNDILADAVNCTQTTFFRGSGSSYTGTLPDTGYRYGTFIVNVNTSSTVRTVIAQGNNDNIAINKYYNGAWSGWQELALKSDLTTQYITDSVDIDYSIAGNSTGNYNLYSAANTKTGYSAVGVVGFSTNHRDIVPLNVTVASSSNYSLYLQNVSSSSVSTNFTAVILYKKN